MKRLERKLGMGILLQIKRLEEEKQRFRVFRIGLRGRNLERCEGFEDFKNRMWKTIFIRRF